MIKINAKVATPALAGSARENAKRANLVPVIRAFRVLRVEILLAVSFLVACTQPATVTPPSATSTPLTPSPTATATSTVTPSPTLTSTATPVPCDPLTADYCIVDGYFVFQRPIAPPGRDTVEPGYPYGSTYNNTRDPHHGVEFVNTQGTPVLAAADGTVVYAGDDTTQAFSFWKGFYGNIVVLEHHFPGLPYDTLYTLYAHLSRIDVTVGQEVSAGTKIGEVGMSGTAFGYHLHFEVRLAAQGYTSTLNPELWLRPHPGDGVLALQFFDAAGKPIRPLDIKVQYFPDPQKPSTYDYYPQVYHPETINPADIWQETAALGDLPAGRYRISFMWAGSVYERRVDVQDGKLTRVAFVVK